MMCTVDFPPMLDVETNEVKVLDTCMINLLRFVLVTNTPAAINQIKEVGCGTTTIKFTRAADYICGFEMDGVAQLKLFCGTREINGDILARFKTIPLNLAVTTWERLTAVITVLPGDPDITFSWYEIVMTKDHRRSLVNHPLIYGEL